MKNIKGFTLIELLVAISIIVLFSGAGLTVFTSAQKRARDSRRKTDLEGIRQALELYRADNGVYPNGGGWYGSAHGNWSTFTGQIVPDFISQVPVDPKNTGVGLADPCSNPDLYRYNYRAVDSDQGYILTAIMEDIDANNGSECSSLPNWGSNCGGVPATDDYCYGVQNP